MLIIKNTSGVDLDINDLGLSMIASQSLDLSRECEARDVAASASAGGDLNAHISAANITVEDPLDSSINLTSAQGILACRAHNDSPYRLIANGRIANPDTALQFNNNGIFGATADLTVDTTNRRLNIRGAAETNMVNIGGNTLIESGSSNAALYVEIDSSGSNIDGMVTYFNRDAGAGTATGGWIKYAYDGATPYIGIVDGDDDSPYISFDTVGTGSEAAPQLRNRFGGIGANANGDLGFSWKENNTEVATLQAGVMNVIGAGAEYQVNGVKLTTGNLISAQESGRLYCYTDNRWVTSGDEDVGTNYYLWQESGGTGADPIQEWEHQGILVNAGSTYRRFTISLSSNSTQVTDIEILISYRKPNANNTYAGGDVDADAEMENTTIYRDNFYNPSSGVAYNSSSLTMNRRTIDLDFDMPDDGWVTVYFRPIGSITNTRFVYTTMSHLIDIGQL